jgi:hypothetical protein
MLSGRCDTLDFDHTLVEDASAKSQRVSGGLDAGKGGKGPVIPREASTFRSHSLNGNGCFSN